MSLEPFQLNGKNALVTGSHRGLGEAIAVALAKAGTNVGCHGRHAKQGAPCDEIRAAGRKTFYFSADLAEPKSYVGRSGSANFRSTSCGSIEDDALVGNEFYERKRLEETAHESHLKCARVIHRFAPRNIRAERASLSAHPRIAGLQAVHAEK